jgi:hypothetical protein
MERQQKGTAWGTDCVQHVAFPPDEMHERHGELLALVLFFVRFGLSIHIRSSSISMSEGYKLGFES